MHGRFTAATAARVAGRWSRTVQSGSRSRCRPTTPRRFKQVRPGHDLPIATGERVHVLAEFRELFEQGTIDIVQADLTHFGGFTGTAQAGRLGRAPTAC